MPMKSSRLQIPVFIAVLIAWMLPLSAVSARPVRNGAVQVDLVAKDTSIQPGKPFWVALKMDHDAHWHSYWINAGTGYRTSMRGRCPPGSRQDRSSGRRRIR